MNIPRLASLFALLAAGVAPLTAQNAGVTERQAESEREKAQKAARQRTLASFQHQDGLVYKTVSENGGEKLLEYLYFPPTVKRYEKTPLVLYIHGGGWASLDRYVILWPNSTPALRRILDSGIAVASIDYRLTRRGVSTAFDCVVDCKDAARFFTLHAEKHGLDSDRIATWGASAGGHLALMTALAPNDRFPGDPALAAANPRFRAVCAWFPATTFVNRDALKGSNFEHPGRFLSMLGGPYDANFELAKLLSPTEHLASDTIPVLLIHGDKDDVLSVNFSRFMSEEAKRIGTKNVKLVVVEGGGHGFVEKGITPSLVEVQTLTAEFLIDHLTDGLSSLP